MFKCRPSMLYPIFVNQWSGTVNDDKLLIGSVNTCVAVRPYRCELSAPIIGLCPKVFPVETYNANLDMAVTYGYAPRYAELKSARDYFEGGFCGTYSSWVTGYDSVFCIGFKDFCFAFCNCSPEI